MKISNLVLTLISFFTLAGISNYLYAADFSAPIIILPISTSTQNVTGSYDISAKVTDNNSVDQVELFYRVIDSHSEYTVVPLYRSLETDIFSVELFADDLDPPGIEYYIQAKDIANNISQEPFPDKPRTLYLSKAPKDEPSASKGSSINWWWVALGAVAVGAAVVSLDDGDEEAGKPNPPDNTSIVITAPSSPTP